MRAAPLRLTVTFREEKFVDEFYRFFVSFSVTAGDVFAFKAEALVEFFYTLAVEFPVCGDLFAAVAVLYPFNVRFGVENEVVVIEFRYCLSKIFICFVSVFEEVHEEACDKTVGVFDEYLVAEFDKTHFLCLVFEEYTCEVFGEHHGIGTGKFREITADFFEVVGVVVVGEIYGEYRFPAAFRTNYQDLLYVVRSYEHRQPVPVPVYILSDGGGVVLVAFENDQFAVRVTDIPEAVLVVVASAEDNVYLFAYCLTDFSAVILPVLTGVFSLCLKLIL